MSIKVGNTVSHAGASEWGVGRVLEVTATKVTIQFSDGGSRKIASSHFSTLQPADAALYVPPPAAVAVVAARPAVKRARKTK
jgi:transcription elongation factor GreA-like protein